MIKIIEYFKKRNEAIVKLRKKEIESKIKSI